MHREGKVFLYLERTKLLNLRKEGCCQSLAYHFGIHVSVHYDIIYENYQQDTTIKTIPTLP
jgi:hypothetical protein